ncbi:MAG TPA: hypothetical protein PLC24_04500 [Myxococcota bacterium]|nr:hypothetical protein [Myxococcota bacterium]
MRHNFRFATLLLCAALPCVIACDDGLGRFRPPNGCTPKCDGRSCGTDGCHGSCGECDPGLFCEPVSGQCTGDGKYHVTGNLFIEYMFGDVSLGRVVVSGPDEVPVRDVLVTVIDDQGNILGAGSVEGSDGRFSVPVQEPLSGSEKLVVSTVWAVDGQVVMAVLDSLSEGRDPGKATFDPFVWYVDVPVGGNVGSVTIDIEDGSGALFVFMMNKLAFQQIVNPLVGGIAGQAIPLAVIFGPADDWYVRCTCYHGLEESHIGTSQGPRLKTMISIVDSPGDASSWGWSVLFHEFGHYILDSYSKDNSPGGYHYIGQELIPKFAFSEGWATFTSLVTATLWFDDVWPVYWDIQGGSWFFVDFNQGVYHTATGGESYMVFPDVKESTNQELDENWVARTLYMIWDGSGTTPDPDASMSLEEMAETISSDIFLEGVDWPRDADLFNFLDSALCLYPEKDPALADRVLNEFGYPYQGNPRCSKQDAAYSGIRDLSPGSGPSRRDWTRAPLQTGDRVGVPRAGRTGLPPFVLDGVTIESGIKVGPGRH